MFDHLGITVRDFARSLKFYTRALEPLGFVAQFVDEAGKSAGFGKPGEPRLWISGGSAGGPAHMAFEAKDREAVRAFHAAAVASGGKDNGGPGERRQYAKGYWAAFVHDPDGNNVEAVVHEG